MSISQPSEEHLSALRKFFGHSQFRPMQWKIIYSIIEEKQDNCVIMSTGYGKSLCYQYPAVYCQGLSIVISPLISLMQDQVLALQMSSIAACYLGSAQKNSCEAINDVLSGVCRVLYVTPEWSTSEYGTNLLERIRATRPITLLAIDEAHCVSQWGHDFRSAYRNLSTLKDILPNVPVLAVTATATPRVRADICSSLKLKNPRITVTSFNRPNLYFAVSSKLNSSKAEQIYKNLYPAMEKSGMGFKFQGPTIIYCSSKNRTEEVEEALRRHDIRSGAYHAGLSMRERNEVHEKFLRDQLDVVVATVAFGMGIDKPNVRCVIHYGLPKEIESYYQEVGRAGRDGLPAKCHVFYSEEDKMLNKMIMTQSQNVKFQEHKDLMVKRMQHFCETRHCRRHLLLSYFDESLSKEPGQPQPNCCDNCDKLRNRDPNMKPVEKLDLTREIKLLLEVFDYFDGRFGLVVPIKFLRGQKDAKISALQTRNRLFGAGKEHTEAAWKALARLLIRENLLQERAAQSFRGRQNYGRSFPMSTVAISQKGRQFVSRDFEEGAPFELSEAAEALFRKRSLVGVSRLENLAINHEGRPNGKTEEQTAFLYLSLKRLRDRIAVDEGCAPHMIIEDGTCYQMALNPPKDLKDLTLRGFTEVKVGKFGQLFLNRINEFFGVGNPSQHSEAKMNDCDEEDFLNMRRLNDNAVNFEEQKFNEYFLTDELLKDLEEDPSLTADDMNTSRNKAECTLEEQNTSDDMWGDKTDDDIFNDPRLDDVQNSSQDMWGDESDDIFDDPNLDDILENNREMCHSTDKKLPPANETNFIDGSHSSALLPTNDGVTETYSSGSCSKAANNESLTCSVSSRNDWTGAPKALEGSSTSLSHSNMNSSEKASTNSSLSPMKKREPCKIKILSSGASAKTSNIMYEDDSDDEEDDTVKPAPDTQETGLSPSNKRSFPKWLTQPEEIKKRMKRNSLFK